MKILNKEIINYIIVGVITLIISIITYYVFNIQLNIHYQIANVISWIVAVTFAYFANKIYVFKTLNYAKKYIIIEILKFTTSRMYTLIIDITLMFILISILKIDELISKIIVQVVVIVLNYLLSKLLVFKEVKNEKRNN